MSDDSDNASVRRDQARVAAILAEGEHGERPDRIPIPDEPLPPIGMLGFQVQRYGMLQRR